MWNKFHVFPQNCQDFYIAGQTVIFICWHHCSRMKNIQFELIIDAKTTGVNANGENQVGTKHPNCSLLSGI